MTGAGELLADAVARLRQARDLMDVQLVVRSAARALVAADGATFVLLDGDQCYYVDEDSMSPLWAGQRFPAATCISGWAMLNRQSVVIPDIRFDARIPQEAYRPTFVRSLAMVPVRLADPVGAIGAYWATRHRATAEEIALLEELAVATAEALERVLPLVAAQP